MSHSLWPHGLQCARPPCPSSTPGACSNSCPLSQWCHPTISSSVVPFSSRIQSFPFYSVQFSCSVMSDSLWPQTAAHQVSLSFNISWSLLQLMSIESGMPSKHLILCCPLLLLPSNLASGSFQMSQFFASGGQSIGVSASTSALTIFQWIFRTDFL